MNARARLLIFSLGMRVMAEKEVQSARFWVTTSEDSHLCVGAMHAEVEQLVEQQHCLLFPCRGAVQCSGLEITHFKAPPVELQGEFHLGYGATKNLSMELCAKATLVPASEVGRPRTGQHLPTRLESKLLAHAARQRSQAQAQRAGALFCRPPACHAGERLPHRAGARLSRLWPDVLLSC